MSWSPASGRKELEAQLRRIGGQADSEIDLAAAALILAALDRPRVSLERYDHHLSLLARETSELGEKSGAANSLLARAEALNTVMLERYGYGGDRRSYDDLQNANLMRVIDRRKGLPVALGILYIHAARAQGWSIAGLNFPGHFMLRLELGGERVILDPFNGGALRGPKELREILQSLAGEDAELQLEHTEPVANREILLRLQNNIKLRLLQERRAEDALTVLETMLMFAPDMGQLWHEAGTLHAHLGNLRAAAMTLEHYLELGETGATPDSAGRHEAAGLLQRIKAQLN
jgi:regulator of sirC expression with transglutaminase-like and TPR domain